MRRRQWLYWSALVGAFSGAARRVAAAPPAAPTSLSVYDYLSHAALLADENRRSADWVFAHPSDVSLASMALSLAERRSALAAKIVPPPEAKQAHMHLLLALENTTAAFDAAVRGDAKRAAQRVAAARAEEQTMKFAFEGAKLKLPTLR